MTTLVIRPRSLAEKSIRWLTSDLSRSLVILSLVIGGVTLGMMRVVALDHLPGVNGDETLDAVQIRDVIAGRPTVLKMPTGRLLSPVYGAWIMALEAWRTPTFTALRLPAVMAGFLSLFLVLLLLRCGRSAFFVTSFAMLLWASPMSLAYSRIAIEQSLIIPAQLILFYFTFRRHLVGIFFSFIVVLLVHPIHIFLIPFLCAILLPKWLENRQSRMIALGFGILFVLGFLFELAVLPKNYSRFLDFSAIAKTLMEFDTWLEFGKYYLRLFSGLTAFEQFASPPQRTWVWVWDILCLALWIGVHGFGFFRAWLKRDREALFLMLGNLALVLGYFVITGKDAISPGVARYALILLVPALLSFVTAMEYCLPKTMGWLRIGVVSLFAWIWILQSVIFYFESIQLHNSTSFRAYLTGSTEPKAAAFDWIRADAKRRGISDESIVVVTEDWWTYWPLRYLASDVSEMKLILLEKNPEFKPKLPSVLAQGGYAIGFSKTGFFEKEFFSLYQPGSVERIDVPGYGGKPVLSIWRIRN